MKQRIFGMVLIAILATNAYSKKLNNAAEVSKNEWRSNLISSFSFRKIKTSYLNDNKLLKHMRDVGETTTFNNSFGNKFIVSTVNTPIQINGESDMTLVNTMAQPSQYQVAYQICVYSITYPMQCAGIMDNFTVGSQGSMTAERALSMGIQFANSGTYTMEVESTITNIASTQFTENFHTIGTIVITDSK